MKTVSQIIDEVIAIEGGYSDHEDDSGGKTMFGITESVARKYGYKGRISELPKMTAKMIYLKEYWEEPKINLIKELSESVATKVFDCGVNMGTAQAVKFLQRALSVLTDLVIEIDGHIGNQTMSALSEYLSQRKQQDGHQVLIKAINSQQGVRYIELAEKWPKNKSFVFGWMANRI